MLRTFVFNALALLAVSQATGLTGSPEKKPKPSAHFREEHQKIHRRLDQISDLNGSLSGLHRQEQGRRMHEIVDFFQKELEPHARWEEKVLYPAVDRRVGSSRPFTSTMRGDHRVVGRWIAELNGLARSSTPDAVRFSRAADRLIGLITAHFENEEEVLLPVLDESMTREEFDREIMAQAHGQR